MRRQRRFPATRQATHMRAFCLLPPLPLPTKTFQAPAQSATTALILIFCPVRASRLRARFYLPDCFPRTSTRYIYAYPTKDGRLRRGLPLPDKELPQALRVRRFQGRGLLYLPAAGRLQNPRRHRRNVVDTPLRPPLRSALPEELAGPCRPAIVPRVPPRHGPFLRAPRPSHGGGGQRQTPEEAAEIRYQRPVQVLHRGPAQPKTRPYRPRRRRVRQAAPHQQDEGEGRPGILGALEEGPQLGVQQVVGRSRAPDSTGEAGSRAGLVVLGRLDGPIDG